MITLTDIAFVTVINDEVEMFCLLRTFTRFYAICPHGYGASENWDDQEPGRKSARELLKNIRLSIFWRMCFLVRIWKNIFKKMVENHE